MSRASAGHSALGSQPTSAKTSVPDSRAVRTQGIRSLVRLTEAARAAGNSPTRPSALSGNGCPCVIMLRSRS